MPEIFAVDRDGIMHNISGQSGISLMRNLKDVGGLDIAAICGGCCSCATCHVYVDEEWLGRLKPQEASELDLVEELLAHRPNSRLSCQIEFTDAMDGLRVTLAPDE